MIKSALRYSVFFLRISTEQHRNMQSPHSSCGEILLPNADQQTSLSLVNLQPIQEQNHPQNILLLCLANAVAESYTAISKF